MKNRIEIVEDNDVVRDGLQLLISSMSNYSVVGAYINCEQALKNLEKDMPDVILMDIDLPGMSGIEGIIKIKKIHPEIHIIVITVHEDYEVVFDALCAGASGYITKTPIIRDFWMLLMKSNPEEHQ